MPRYTLNTEGLVADICMCLNRDCPMRTNCYRYLAPAWPRQSYGGFAPGQEGACGHYMSADGRTGVREAATVDAQIDGWKVKWEDRQAR